jgi:hypothetical protein
MSFPSTPIQHRLKVRSAPIMLALHQFECELRCHMPAIVVANPQGLAFDPVKLTVSVQPAIQEVMRVKGAATPVTLPILDDVPIKIPNGGGFCLTFPIAIGDECELSFQDMAFDMWWQNGGVNQQPGGPIFRHAIGDAMAEFGPRSQPNPIPNYSTTSAQLRSVDGAVVVDLAETGITLIAPVVTLGDAGTAQPLVNGAWLTWFTANVQPFLVSKGYAGPVMPAVSSTQIVKGQ